MREAAGSTFRLTKIVGTIGPASGDPGLLAKLIEQGLRVVRLNFSHGTLAEHEAHVSAVRTASERVATPVAILGDLAGPKIRLTEVPEEGLTVEPGDRVAFSADVERAYYDAEAGVTVLGTNHPPLAEEVGPGQRVLVDDGHVRMLALEQTGDGGPWLICRVTREGMLSSRKGVNLPDTDLSMPSLTDYDYQCIDWAVEQGLDYLALSFVRRHEDIEQLRSALQERDVAGRPRTPIVAKIETPQALDDLEAIVDAADDVMVARGDLGVEMEAWDVPIIQKRIIGRAHDYGKPAIVATQMLQSMTENPSATRAEVSDVANAVLDGADALMLSGETAVGQHPEAVVQVMARAAGAAEAYNMRAGVSSLEPPVKLRESRYRTAALAHGVNVVVRDLHARAVVLWSELGGGGRYLSQNRLGVPIFAISSNPAALRQMCLMFGVQPVSMARPADATSFLHAVDELMLARGWAGAGDPIVVAMGEPLGTPGVTNEIRIHYIGDVCRVRWHAKER